MTLLLFVWLMSGAVAYGWILHSDHYGAAFDAYGKCYFGFAGAMTLAVLLYYFRRDLWAAVLGLMSYLLMLWLLLKATGLADEYGWTGQTEQSFGRNAATVWRNGMMWNAVPFLLLMLLCLTRFFSYEAASKRAQKRAEKAAAENASAPSILGGDSTHSAGHATENPPLRQDPVKTAGNRKRESSK